MDQKQTYNIVTFLSLIFFALVYWSLFDFLRWDMFDSPSFVGAARQMFGLEGGYNFQSRLSKPLVLIFPGALEYFTSIGAQVGFLLQSIIAFFGCGFLINKIVYNVTNRRDLGLFAMFIYVLSQPFAIFSLMILVDAPGWFLSLLIINRAILLVKNNRENLKQWMILSALSAFGLLVKESVVFGFIFILFYQFFTNKNLKKKIFGAFVSCCIFIAVFLFSQIITHFFFHDSIILVVFSEQSDNSFVYYNLRGIFQLFRAFDLYWFLVILGLFALKQATKKHALQTEILAFICATVLSLILLPIWPYIVDRILFMIAPALVVFAVKSEVYLKRLFFPLILIGGILNIMTSWIIYKYNVEGLLLGVSVFYLLLVLIALVWNKKKSFAKEANNAD